MPNTMPLGIILGGHHLPTFADNLEQNRWGEDDCRILKSASSVPDELIIESGRR